MADKERRSAPRVRPAAGAASEVTLDLETQVLRLSEGGMSFEVAMPVDIGAQLSLVLALDGEELVLSGVVRNCASEPALGTPTYTVGVEFDSLDDQARAVLRRFVGGRESG